MQTSSSHIRSRFLCNAVGLLGATSTTLWAGPPINYDNWSVSSGSIQANCPNDAQCSEPTVVDDGFFVREITRNGQHYFQTILTEPGTTGSAAAEPFTSGRGNLNFASEGFVRTGTPTNTYITGLADKITIYSSIFTSPTTEERFLHQATLRIGWATDTLTNRSLTYTPGFDLTTQQRISSVDYATTTPIEVFSSEASLRSIPGYTFDNEFKQTINLSASGTQQFQQRHISGYLQTSDHTMDPANPLLPGGTNGGDFAWGVVAPAATPFLPYWVDQIKVTWVGQSSLSGDPAGAFSSTSYWGESAGLSPAAPLGETRLVRFADPGPAAWAAPFGPAPQFGQTVSVAPTASIGPPVMNAVPMPPVARPVVTAGSGPPTALDQWSVNQGTVSLISPCPTGATCSTPIVGNGFLQREIKTGSDRYFQTILTDNGANGNPSSGLPFASETFVRAGSDGLAAKLQWQWIHNLGGAFNESLDYRVVQSEGWALTSVAAPTLLVDQHAHSNGNAIIFDSDYSLKLAGDESRDMAIAYDISTVGAVYPIMFRQRLIEGSWQTTNRLLDPAAPLLPGGSNGGDLSWSASDSIQATWIGSRYIVIDPANLNDVLGFTRYANLSQGTATSYTSLSDPNPASWIAPFGPPAPSWILTLPQ